MFVFYNIVEIIVYTPGPAGGPCGRDRTLAVKSRKTAEKSVFFVKKKYFVWVIFFSPRKKGHFRAIFRDGQRSVTAAWATRSPWSI